MKNRSHQNEKLDDLSLTGESLHKALQSLAWINRWFGNHRSVINAIRNIPNNENKILRITDLGCGGGDLILAVAKSLQKNKTQFSITGIDGNENTLDYARKKCNGLGEIKFIQADILADTFTIEPCDILVSSHFMYHFTEDGLVQFFKHNLPHISTAAIFSELERNSMAMKLFKLSSYLLPISKLAKEDGLLAIQRAFTKKEWLAVLQKANITAFVLKSLPLFRIRLMIFKQFHHHAGK